MDKFLIVFLIWIFLVPQCLAMCSEEQIKTFVWKETVSSQNEITSIPMCIDKNHLPVTRQCNNNTWIPIATNIKCKFKQNVKLKWTFCPPEYIRIQKMNLCVLITVPQKWSELCLQSTEGNPPHKKYMGVREKLLDKGDKRYWLPIRRDHRLDYVKYKTIKHYNVRFNETSNITEPIDGDCITYSPSDDNYHLSNCDTLHRMVCLTDVVEFFEFSNYNCPQGSYTTYNSHYHNRCYRMVEFNGSNQLRHPLVINSAQEQFLADQFVITGENLWNSNVLVEIMPINANKTKITDLYKFNRTNWIQNKRQIKFTNWDLTFQHSQLSFSEPYTTIKNGKWYLEFDPESIQYAIQVEEFDSIVEPEFKFQFNKTLHKFQTNTAKEVSNFLYQSCFLNDIVMDNTSLGIGRKYFRCEGFTMKTLKRIKSPTIEVWSDETLNYEIFVIILSRKCTNCNHLFESYLLQDEITSLEIKDWIIQFRKIFDINTKSKITTFSLHLLAKKSNLTIKSMYVNLPKLLRKLPYNILYSRHIDICLGGVGKYLNFADAQIGGKSVNRNCRQTNDEHPTLKCIGDSNVGAYWQNDLNVNNLKCDYDQILKDVYLNISTLDPVDVVDILAITSQTSNTIESLEYSNKIIDELVNKSENTELFDLDADKPGIEQPFSKLVKIYDNALQTSDYLVQDSPEAQNISSNLLINYKKMIDAYLNTNASTMNLKRSHNGTYLIHDSNIILLVIDPFLGPASGMSIHKKRLRRKETSFLGFKVEIHDNNSTIKRIIDRRLEAGINIHASTINKLKGNYSNFRIVLSVFYKDSWFIENSSAKDVIKSKSKIIGVFIPEYPDKELPDGISSILKIPHNRRKPHKDGCSNWQPGIQERGWNKNFHAYENLNGKRVNCPIKHTSFSGYVQLIGSDKLIDCNTKSHTDIIKWITIVMSALSVIGVLLIFVAVLTIPALKRNETTPLILIQVFANGLQILVYILFVELKLFNAHGNEMIEEFCLATGATLHYLTLVGFFLSLFATDHLIRAYVMGTNQLIATTFKIKVILFGWMLPICIVSLCIFCDLIFDFELYLPIDVLDDHSSICYPVEELLLISIHLPITIIIIIHVIIFVWVVIKTNRNPDSVITKVSRLKEKCQTYVYIFSILSITWLFAVIVYYVENCWVHLIFSYLFAISAPSQGFQIFLVCVLFNGQVQNYFKRWHRNRKLN